MATAGCVIGPLAYCHSIERHVNLDASGRPMSATMQKPVEKGTRSRPASARPLVIKGYIRKVGNVYQGVCLTLDLSVEGKSLDETSQKLHTLIVEYLRDAQEDGTWSEFVPRRAPASYYLTYYGYLFLAAVNAVKDFSSFVESAPVCASHA
jgi:hypothetical protein